MKQSTIHYFTFKVVLGLEVYIYDLWIKHQKYDEFTKVESLELSICHCKHNEEGQKLIHIYKMLVRHVFFV